MGRLVRFVLMGLGVVFLVSLGLRAVGIPRESAEPAAVGVPATDQQAAPIRGRVTDVPCYRILALTSPRGVTTVIDVVYSGPRNDTYCNAGNPLDGHTFDGYAATETTVAELPPNLHFTCEASATQHTDPQDVMVLVYDDKTLDSHRAASQFCQGVRDNQPNVVLTGYVTRSGSPQRSW